MIIIARVNYCYLIQVGHVYKTSIVAYTSGGKEERRESKESKERHSRILDLQAFFVVNKTKR